MANEPISGLPDGSPAQSTDQIPVNRGGTNFRISLGNTGSSATVRPTEGGVYLSQNCPSPNPGNCYQIYGDVLSSYSATYAMGSHTVTTLSTDPPFVCPGGIFPCSSGGDVGKIGFAAGNCPGLVNPCSYDFPQGTITTVTSAHVVQMSTTATRNSSGNDNENVFLWGHDDGAQIVAAFASLFSPSSVGGYISPVRSLYLPCAPMFTSLPPFIATGLVQNGASIFGCGSGAPIIPLPKMNCTGACLFNGGTSAGESVGLYLSGWRLHDITFWGGGTDNADSAAVIGANATGVMINLDDYAENVWVIGWLWKNLANPVTGIYNYFGGTIVNSGSLAGGNNPCKSSGFLGAVATWIGGDCGGSYGDAFLVVGNGAGQITSTTGMYINQNFGVTGIGMHVNGGTLVDSGSDFTVETRVEGATSVVLLNGTTLDNFHGGVPALYVLGGVVTMSNCPILGDISIHQTGGTIIDNGGNGPLPEAPVAITNLYGSASITGIADVAGNHVLTSGWGTASVGSVGGSTNDVKFTITVTGGSPGANPVLTDTFAVPYWVTPGGGCSLIQVGGIFGDILNPAESLLSSTGVTWTFAGTPVSGHAYTFVRHCGN